MPAPPKNYTESFDTPTELTMRPIGVIRSPHKERFGTPRQALVADESGRRENDGARIELFTDVVPQEALTDLAGFERIWVLGFFHLNRGWNAMVRPPRGPKVKRGLLSTRAPHRPNGIALSACQVLKVEKNIISLGPTDLLDGTPVLDVKPYLPYADAFPESRAGWVDELEPPGDK